MKFSTFTIARADTGAILPLCKVSVYLANGTTLASIYQADGVTGLLNPLTADNAANIAFAATNGTYILKAVSSDGSYTVPNITVDIFDLNAVVAALAAGITTGIIGKTYATKALMNADLVPADGIFALVYNDSTAVNNDLYRKTGATTTGSWSVTGLLSSAAASYATQAAASAVQAANSATAAAASATGAASAGVPAAKEQVDRALETGRNLHDVSRGSLGYLITASNGVAVNNFSGAYYATDFIPVTAAIAIYCNVPTYTTGGYGYAWYDGSKAYLSGSATSVAANTAITPPTNACFVRLSLNGADRNGAVITQGTVATVFREFNHVDGLSAARIGRSLDKSLLPNRFNLFVRSQMIASSLLDAGGNISANAAYVRTGFIPVDNGNGIAAGASFSAGSSSYGWVMYDRNKNYVGALNCGANITTVTGSNQITVNSFSAGGFTIGMPVSASAGIPAGAYITSLPAGGYGATGVYGINANATASGTVTGGGGGSLAGVTITLPPLANVAFVASSFNAVDANYLIISDGNQNPADTTRGFIGWSDIERLYPWAGQQIAFLGDSIMADPSGQNTAQLGLEFRLCAHGIFQGVSGRKTRELLDGASGGYTSGPTGSWVAGDASSLALAVSNCGTNDFGINSGGTYKSGRTIGVISDRWIPTDAVGATTSGSNTFTVSSVARGGLVVGMPVQAGSGFISPGTVITAIPAGGGVGTYTMSNVATGGAGTDSFNGGTLYADLYDIYIRKLMTWNTALSVHIATPLPRYDLSSTGDPLNNLGLRVSDYRAAILTFGAFNGISVYDLFARCGINIATFSALTIDGLHSNASGYAHWLPGFAKAINNAA